MKFCLKKDNLNFYQSDKRFFFIITLLLSSISILIALFILAYLNNGLLVHFDFSIAKFMAEHRTKSLINFFTWITYLGRATEVTILLIAISIISILYRYYKELISLWISVGGAMSILAILKLIFHRSRPEFAYYFEPTYSFPSGHATISMALYGFLGYLLIKNSTKLWKRISLFFITITIVSLISFSRIYLTEHYLSDVLTGLLLGSFWAVVGAFILKWLKYCNIGTNKPPFAYTKVLTLFITLLSIAIILYHLTTHPYRVYNPISKTFLSITKKV